MKKKLEIDYDDKAFREGYSAGITGGFSEDNPYPRGIDCPVGDNRSRNWVNGFIKGKSERESAKREGRPVKVHQYRPIPGRED